MPWYNSSPELLMRKTGSPIHTLTCRSSDLHFSGSGSRGKLFPMKKALTAAAILALLAGCTTPLKEGETKKDVAIDNLSKRVPNDASEEAVRFGETETYPENILAKQMEPVEDISVVPEEDTPEEPVAVKRPPREMKPSGNIPVEEKKFAPWVGECLLYQAKWKSINLGKGLISCTEEKTQYGNVYHMVAVTVPQGFLASMGIGYNRVDSYVHPVTLQPYYFYSYTRNSRSEQIVTIEFNTRKKEFNWATKKIVSGELKKSKKGTVAYKDKIYDSMTLFYLVRTMDLDKEKKFQIPVGITKLWNLSFVVSAVKKEEVPLYGQRDIYIIDPQARSDEGFFNAGTLTIRLLADAGRVPVSFSGRTPIGATRLLLHSVQRLPSGEPLDRKKIARLLSFS